MPYLMGIALGSLTMLMVTLYPVWIVILTFNLFLKSTIYSVINLMILSLWLLALNNHYCTSIMQKPMASSDLIILKKNTAFAVFVKDCSYEQKIICALWNGFILRKIGSLLLWKSYHVFFCQIWLFNLSTDIWYNVKCDDI